MEQIKRILRWTEEHGLYPDTKIVSSAPSPEITIGEKSYISFCSNNYLGLSIHPEVKQASIEAIQKYGTGAGGARLVSGTYEVHIELEKVIAKFKCAEDAMVFSAGYLVNIGTISALMDLPATDFFSLFKQKGIILSDELNHASIVDGCRLSHAKKVIYKHRDMGDLKSKLKKYKRKRKLIVTDGVFSMDGDIAPLPDIVMLAKKYNAMIMVDDAHSTGVLGKNGRGTAEHFGLEGKVDIYMGTLSKALGGAGGFVAGNKELIKYLRIRARSYVFSTAMPPGVAGGLLTAFKQIENNPVLREKLWRNADYLRTSLKKEGFSTLESETQIIPMLIGDEENAMKTAKLLFEKGIFVAPIGWPAVPKKKARIRFTVMALHTREQIDFLIKECVDVGRTLRII